MVQPMSELRLRSNVESAEWAGLESDRVSESSQSLRANKSLQSQYTQENPKVINGLQIIKDAFQHINKNKTIINPSK